MRGIEEEGEKGRATDIEKKWNDGGRGQRDRNRELEMKQHLRAIP